MTANPTSSIAASASSTVDLDAQASRAADGELSARLHSDVIPLLEPPYQHAMPMTRNHADAEDLLQETIVKAYAGFRTFQPGGNFHAWLHRILINTYISYYRKQQCRPAQYPIDDIAGPQLAANAQHLVPGLHSAEEQALERLGDNQIRATMQALPEQFRLAVYYADVEGLRSREMVGPQTDDCLTGGVTAADAHRLRRPAVAALLGPARSSRGNATRPLSTDSGLAGGINGCHMGVNRDDADLGQPQR